MISPALSGFSVGFERGCRSLDRRLADPVLEAELGAPGRELVAVLAPDHLDARTVLVGAACLLNDGP
jgi:hypothetical protein